MHSDPNKKVHHLGGYMQEGVLAALEGLDVQTEGKATGDKESHHQAKHVASDNDLFKSDNSMTHHWKLTQTQTVEFNEDSQKHDKQEEDKTLSLDAKKDGKKRCGCSCFGRVKK